MRIVIWPFKKKLELPKKKKTLAYHTEKFDVGITHVEVMFEGPFQFDTVFYGEVIQSNWAYTPGELQVSEPKIHSSLDKARSWLHYIDSNNAVTVLDDPNDPTIARSGKIISARILGSDAWDIDFQVASVVEVES